MKMQVVRSFQGVLDSVTTPPLQGNPHSKVVTGSCCLCWAAAGYKHFPTHSYWSTFTIVHHVFLLCCSLKKIFFVFISHFTLLFSSLLHLYVFHSFFTFFLFPLSFLYFIFLFLLLLLSFFPTSFHLFLLSSPLTSVILFFIVKWEDSLKLDTYIFLSFVLFLFSSVKLLLTEVL